MIFPNLDDVFSSYKILFYTYLVRVDSYLILVWLILFFFRKLFSSHNSYQCFTCAPYIFHFTEILALISVEAEVRGKYWFNSETISFKIPQLLSLRYELLGNKCFMNSQIFSIYIQPLPWQLETTVTFSFSHVAYSCKAD